MPGQADLTELGTHRHGADGQSATSPNALSDEEGKPALATVPDVNVTSDAISIESRGIAAPTSLSPDPPASAAVGVSISVLEQVPTLGHPQGNARKATSRQDQESPVVVSATSTAAAAVEQAVKAQRAAENSAKHLLEAIDGLRAEAGANFWRYAEICGREGLSKSSLHLMRTRFVDEPLESRLRKLMERLTSAGINREHAERIVYHGNYHGHPFLPGAMAADPLPPSAPGNDEVGSADAQGRCELCEGVKATGEGSASRKRGEAQPAFTSKEHTLLDELRTWVGGLERIGDAEQVVALLVQNEVSLANLGSLSVDDLATIGMPKPVARELHVQFNRRVLPDMESSHALPYGPHAEEQRQRQGTRGLLGQAHVFKVGDTVQAMYFSSDGKGVEQWWPGIVVEVESNRVSVRFDSDDNVVDTFNLPDDDHRLRHHQRSKELVQTLRQQTLRQASAALPTQTSQHFPKSKAKNGGAVDLGNVRVTRHPKLAGKLGVFDANSATGAIPSSVRRRHPQRLVHSPSHAKKNPPTQDGSTAVLTLSTKLRGPVAVINRPPRPPQDTSDEESDAEAPALVELILALCVGLMKSDAGRQRFYMRLVAKLCAGVCA